MDPFARREVLHSAEFDRVDALPRRTWTIEEGRDLAADLTRRLKTPAGTMTLEPQQAIALREAYMNGGFFGSMGVGSGKTLFFLLLLGNLLPGRNVLIIDAGLDNDGRKTEIAEYARHWRFQMPRVVHFQEIQVIKGKYLLDEIDPAHVGIDESHLFKNKKAARTARFSRWRKAHPEAKVYAATGTVAKREIEDFCHVVAWCLGPGAPVPLSPHIVEEWGSALNNKISDLNQADPGVLLRWADPQEILELGETRAARRGFCRRFLETPGVVGYSLGADKLTASVEISELRLPLSRPVQEAFEIMRSKQEMPDGTQLVSALDWTRHARTLPLGYWLKWKYPGPLEWMARRKAAGSFIREALSRSRTYDSPAEIYKAYPDAPELASWLEIADTYKPETVPEWICGEALALCAKWLQAGPGVCFTENTAFGEALAVVAGVPYFGAGGCDASGRSIEHYTGDSCVAGCDSNGKGRNLQRWNRMLVAPPSRNGPELQQLIGRFQRLGQKADRITVEITVGCIEHLRNFHQSVSDSEFAEDLLDSRMIACGASVAVTNLGDEPSGAPWEPKWGRHVQRSE